LSRKGEQQLKTGEGVWGYFLTSGQKRVETRVKGDFRAARGPQKIAINKSDGKREFNFIKYTFGEGLEVALS
jgi:hypothetical protein